MIVNRAIGATNSGLYATCFKQLVPQVRLAMHMPPPLMPCRIAAVSHSAFDITASHAWRSLKCKGQQRLLCAMPPWQHSWLCRTAAVQHPQETDLAVVEFTFNEFPSAPYPDPTRRGFEQLLRKLLRLPSSPAVVVLHHFAWYYSYGDGVDAGLYYRPAEAQLGTMAQVCK